MFSSLVSDFPLCSNLASLVQSPSSASPCEPPPHDHTHATSQVITSSPVPYRRRTDALAVLDAHPNRIPAPDALCLPQGDPKAKKKKAKFDKDYVLRFNALYLSPLKDAMVAYAERDVNGAKAAGGAGLPKFIQRTSAPVSESALYQVPRHSRIPTPNISSLHRTGLVFAISWAAAPPPHRSTALSLAHGVVVQR